MAEPEEIFAKRIAAEIPEAPLYGNAQTKSRGRRRLSRSERIFQQINLSIFTRIPCGISVVFDINQL